MAATAQQTARSEYSSETSATSATSAAPPAGGRIASLDIARGAIMVLMAIDHVRVYSGVPAGGRALGVFFTRWVTNFSAPGFAFLAGTGAYLYARKVNDRRTVASFLATRGLFLVLLELTVMRLSWTFNLDFANYNLAGVLWMLGWCMVLMAGLVWLPTVAIAVVGLAIVVAQPLFGPISSLLPDAIGKFLYLGGQAHLGASGPPIDVLYVIVPWIGVMAVGYAFGAITTWNADARRRAYLWIGGLSTAAFVLVATMLALRAPASPNAARNAAASAAPLLLRVLNQRKYPASPLFLLMTLGPMIAFLPVAEHMRGWFGRMLATFGRVPLFFYLVHIPLIHALACVLSAVREGRVDPWLFTNHPMEPGPLPPGYRWSLPLLYGVYAVAIALSYEPCRRFAELKAKGGRPWLRYL